MNKEKKQYEVGDRVQIQSLEWYNKNKDCAGNVHTSPAYFTEGMVCFCGMYGTIQEVCTTEKGDQVYYRLDIDNEGYYWSADMFVPASSSTSEASSTSETIIPAEYRKPFHQVLDEMEDLYQKKNKRYGNSFSKTYETLGLISAVTCINHKHNRLCALAKNPDLDQLDESIEDTLIDMANYCVMTLMERGSYKPGDFVATKDGKFIGIFKAVADPDDYDEPMYTYANGSWCEEELLSMVPTEILYFDRQATQGEKEKLIGLMQQNGYRWNAKTLTIETITQQD